MLATIEKKSLLKVLDHSKEKLLRAALVIVVTLSALSMQGCGGGGSGEPQAPAPAPVYSTAPTPSATTYQNVSNLIRTNYLQISASEYRFSVTPNFYYSTDNQSFWSIQANVATSLTDINSRNVFRIDIAKNGAPLPLLNKSFSIEAGGQFEKFPGTFNVLDGQQSSAKKVEKGTIVFSPDSVMSEQVSGSFDVVLTDYDSTISPAPHYALKGVFSFRMGGYGPAT